MSVHCCRSDNAQALPSVTAVKLKRARLAAVGKAIGRNMTDTGSSTTVLDHEKAIRPSAILHVVDEWSNASYCQLMRC